MTPEELQRDLTTAGIACRVRRGEVVVETCYFCGNEKANLELNPERGLFHCWACNEGGRLDRFLHEWLGQEVYLPVRSAAHQDRTAMPAHTTAPFAAVPAHTVPSALHYLSRRRIDQNTATTYGLLVCTEAKHPLVNRLVIPIPEFWTGNIVGYLGRTYTNQRPKYLSTLSRRVVAGYRVRSPRTPCIVVEGFFDGIAVHRAGYHAAILQGTTAPGVKEFGARLPQEMPVLVMLDGAAREEAERLCWTLRSVRPGQVQLASLPIGKDPAEFQPRVLQLFVTKVLAQSEPSRISNGQ